VIKNLKQAYRTSHGICYNASIEDFSNSSKFKDLQNSVDLILTSPPYPLAAPKAYGNKIGQDYLDWLVSIVGNLLPLLKKRGSMVIEIGNAWNKGEPTMSTLPLETLLAIKNSLNLYVCQQFIWHNPSKLPGPASYVNIKRIRVKDSFTHIWWFAKDPMPYADNRKVLEPYKDGMKKLLATQNYNRGTRPSGHTIGDGFLKSNSGSIPSSVLNISNTKESSVYREWCKANDLPQHPARMPEKLAEFFINFLTKKGGLVFDPFGGSNTTGSTAQKLERRWVVVEQSAEYVMGSKGRFKKN
jgi:DNA modification methylase